MGEVIHVDFLFARLCRDVSRWYKKYYFGKDIDKRINLHLMVLQEKYDESKFTREKPEALEKEVVEFLTMVQNVTNGYGG